MRRASRLDLGFRARASETSESFPWPELCGKPIVASMPPPAEAATVPRKLLHGQWTIDLDTRATIAHIDLDSQGLFVDWAVQYFLNHTKQIACAFAGVSEDQCERGTEAARTVFNFRQRGPAWTALSAHDLLVPSRPLTAKVGTSVAMDGTLAAIGAPDHDGHGAVFVFENQVATVADVEVELTLRHSFVGDLSAFLVSPFGTEVALFTRRGGNGDDFVRIRLDDEAATAKESEPKSESNDGVSEQPRAGAGD